MKAIAVAPIRKELGMIDQPEPEINSSLGVKLRMLEAGVCGTDKEICSFEYGTPPPGSEQLVIGHESLGEVIEIGSAVKRVTSVIWWSRWCGGRATIIALHAAPIARTFVSRGTLPSAESRASMALWPNSLSITRSI